MQIKFHAEQAQAGPSEPEPEPGSGSEAAGDAMRGDASSHDADVVRLLAERPPLPQMAGRATTMPSRLVLQVDSYGPLGILWNESVPSGGRTPALRVADIIHGTLAHIGCPELHPGMFVVRINGYNMSGLPVSRMLDLMLHRPVTIEFADKLVVAVEEFVPWSSDLHGEAHNEAHDWKKALDQHNTVDPGSGAARQPHPMAMHYAGAHSHAKLGADPRAHLSPSEALAELELAKLDPSRLLALPGAAGGGEDGGAAPLNTDPDERFKGYLGMPRYDDRKIESVTIYLRLPLKVYVDKVEFMPAGGPKPYAYGRAEQTKALQSATAKRLFDSHDKDGSGELSEAEVGNLIDQMAAEDKTKKNDKLNKKARREKHQAFLDMDADKSEHVGFDEFMAWWNHDASHGLYAAKAKALFEKHDEDKSGFLDEKETQKLAKDMGVAMSNDEITVLDANRDDKISFDEFYSWFVAKQNGPPVKDEDKVVFKLEPDECIVKVQTVMRQPAGPLMGIQFVTNTARRSEWVGDPKCDPVLGSKQKHKRDFFPMDAANGFEIIGLQFSDEGECPVIDRLLQRPRVL
eukprot:SAG22_NODE_24_length_30194_cov_6.086327_4_plen_574_part_00